MECTQPFISGVDQATCCDARGICDMHACGTGHTLRSDAASKRCLGKTCDYSDQQTCCISYVELAMQAAEGFMTDVHFFEMEIDRNLVATKYDTEMSKNDMNGELNKFRP